MSTDYLDRIRKELTLSVTALREAVIVVSERVTRKVQVLTLHWRASQLTRDLQQQYRELGRHVVTRLVSGSRSATGTLLGLQPQLEAVLAATVSRVRLLKKDLVQADALVRELAAESLGETLLALQRDLSTRGATIERVVLGTDSPVVGRSVRQLALHPKGWVAAVVRGPVLLAPIDSLVFRAGDMVLFVGLRAELAEVLPALTERQRASA